MASLETKANHRACIFDIYFATIDWTWNLAKIRGANFGKFPVNIRELYIKCV